MRSPQICSCCSLHTIDTNDSLSLSLSLSLLQAGRFGYSTQLPFVLLPYDQTETEHIQHTARAANELHHPAGELPSDWLVYYSNIIIVLAER